MKLTASFRLVVARLTAFTAIIAALLFFQCVTAAYNAYSQFNQTPTTKKYAGTIPLTAVNQLKYDICAVNIYKVGGAPGQADSYNIDNWIKGRVLKKSASMNFLVKPNKYFTMFKSCDGKREATGFVTVQAPHKLIVHEIDARVPSSSANVQYLQTGNIVGYKKYTPPRRTSFTRSSSSRRSSSSGGSRSSGPASYSLSLHNGCSRTVKIFRGKQPRFGSGTTSSLSSNNTTSFSGFAGEMFWIVDQSGNGLDSYTTRGGSQRVSVNSNCTGFSG